MDRWISFLTDSLICSFPSSLTLFYKVLGNVRSVFSESRVFEVVNNSSCASAVICFFFYYQVVGFLARCVFWVMDFAVWGIGLL